MFPSTQSQPKGTKPHNFDGITLGKFTFTKGITQTSTRTGQLRGQ